MHVLGIALLSAASARTATLGLLFILLLVSRWILSLRHQVVQQARQLATMRERLAQRSVALVLAEQRTRKLDKTVGKQSTVVLQAAHELRSPAASIYNTLDVMLQGYAGGAPPEQVEMLFLLRDRAGAMLDMLNDCLSLGALRNAGAEKQIVPVQLLDALSSAAPAARIKATLKGIELSLHVPAQLPPVAAVQEHMVQLLSNLMDNAIKYTDRGGSVLVSMREDGGYVVGSVEDTGIGIRSEDLSRVFEEFFRAENAKRVEPYGSGLGLPLVKRVVAQYGGCLEVHSELGVGTKFTFTMPTLAAVEPS